MKRIIVLLLSVITMVSLAACSTDVTTKEGTVSTTQATEAVEPYTEEANQTEASTAPVATEAPTVPETQASAFDTSWATNEFELQIAEPEFETWEVKGFTEGRSWKIFVTEVYYGDVKNYADALRSYGFHLNEEERDNYNGLGYVFCADNENGYRAELYFEAVYSDTLKGSFSLEISK